MALSPLHVWLKNPATGGVWACPIDYAETAQRRGWEPSDPPVEEEFVDGVSVPDPAPDPPAKRVRAKKRTTTTKTGD